MKLEAMLIIAIVTLVVFLLGSAINSQASGFVRTGTDPLETEFVGLGSKAQTKFATDALSRVTRSPPVADAGDDRTIEANIFGGALVALDGTGSFDPDGDSLTYTWIGSFGTASGATPTVKLPLGSHTITLTVTDGRFSSSDSLIITVIDTTPPTIKPLKLLVLKLPHLLALQ